MSALPTMADVRAAVTSAGLPSVLGTWPANQAPPLPYVVLVPTESRNQTADGRVYSRARLWDVELYMRALDMATVVRLEDAMDAAGIAYGSVVPIVDDRNHYALVRLTVTLQE